MRLLLSGSSRVHPDVYESACLCCFPTGVEIFLSLFFCSPPLHLEKNPALKHLPLWLLKLALERDAAALYALCDISTAECGEVKIVPTFLGIFSLNLQTDVDVHLMLYLIEVV